jgi:dienelactone hydrolase
MTAPIPHPTTKALAPSGIDYEVVIPVSGQIQLHGRLTIPAGASGVVLFAHGSGSSRFSPRNQYVAKVLVEAGIGSLLMDLLTPDEEAVYETRFDIELLSGRLVDIIEWHKHDAATKGLKIGLFGASTGAAAALQAAATAPLEVASVVSRGGRADLAGQQALENVRAPTLLIVGARDDVVVDLNRQAYRVLSCEKTLHIVPRATHLFEEPGTLEQVAEIAKQWFEKHFL